MSNTIPYVISEAYPDYKRPYLRQDFGVIDAAVKDTFFVEKVAAFIYERCDLDHPTVDDIDAFFHDYYTDSFMSNEPWSAKIFINNEWEPIIVSTVEIVECLKRLIDNKSEEDDEDYDDNLLDWKLTDEEADIQNQMKQYMETELEKSDLEIMNTMNESQRIIYILNKCMLNISSTKYKENKELFYKFLQIILRFTEHDIALTTEQMQTNHDEQISLKLSYLMNVYGSLIEYKQIFTENS